MQTILIANPKGGSGKSTLSTCLATYFAWQGRRVVLGDIDRQQSARHWLAQRSPHFPAIERWEIDSDALSKPPKHADIAILDSPAGLYGKRFDAVLKLADRVLVPVQASSFDMWASEAFFTALAEEKRVRKGRIEVGVVGMRIKENTRVADNLSTFLARFELPVLTSLRDTQYYVQTLPRGLGIFDLPAPRVRKDLTQWRPILEWLKS